MIALTRKARNLAASAVKSAAARCGLRIERMASLRTYIPAKETEEAARRGDEDKGQAKIARPDGNGSHWKLLGNTDSPKSGRDRLSFSVNKAKLIERVLEIRLDADYPRAIVSSAAASRSAQAGASPLHRTRLAQPGNHQ